jgi:HK97 family phage major capsid protein
MASTLSPQAQLIQEARAARLDQEDRDRERSMRRSLTGEEAIYYEGAYDERGRAPISFFQDLFLAATSPKANPRSADRIQRYRERTERFIRGRGLTQINLATGQPETRAITSATMGGLIPPAYLGNLYAKASRNGRVFADQMNRSAPLPDTGMSVILPRVTTSSAAGVQATENTAVTTQDIAETDLTVPVRTLAGYLPVSRQALERGQYSDQVLFEDLTARYFALLDSQCISGSGSSGQILGALNTSSITTVSEATASAPRIYVASVNLIQQVNTALGGTGYVVTKAFMHPRRWQWLCAQMDSNSRPYVGQGTADSQNVYGYQDNNPTTPGYVGVWAGIPTYTDANINTTLGSSTNEDRIIFCATDVCHVWERSVDPVTVSFEGQTANSLQVQLVVFGYAAATWGRFPSATAVLTGAALATPAF